LRSATNRNPVNFATAGPLSFTLRLPFLEAAVVLGLRSKVILAVALAIAVVTGTSALYFPGRIEAGAAAVEEAQARHLVGVLTWGLTPYAEVGDLEGLKRELGRVRGGAALAYAVCVDPSGRVLALDTAPGTSAEDAETRPVTTPEVWIRPRLVHALAPLTDAQGRTSLGTVAIGLSREAALETSELATERTLWVSALILVTGLGIALMVSAGVTKPLVVTSRQLTGVSQDLVSTSRAREASAAQEAAAIEQTRRTMDVLLQSAQKIADSASAVLGNAERTLEGNREIAQRIEDLNQHAEKVAELLASIMQVADRTDLLALNAALEGTKAGEAGKGFTLVAKEMRRLAENVMESVAGIRRLLADVRQASQSAVQASEHGTQFSEETTRSVREIALVTQQQRKATEQISRSMDEMTELLNHAMAEIRQTTRSAASLSQLSGGLSALLGSPRAPRRA
jgi:hypothetical protein